MPKARVMIVEDEVIIGMDLKMQLESFGYEVPSLVASGEAALSLVKEESPDIVLMDIVLKGSMDGIECAEKMRSDYDIPIIFTTAYADRERLNKVKFVLPFGYLIKPYNERNLQVTMEMALYTAKIQAERKKTEEALRESERRYRELVENANTIIMKVARDGTIVFFNEFAQKFFGFSEKEILGRSVIGSVVPLRESSGRDISRIVQEVVRNPQYFEEFENENMRKNGERVWVNWRNKPLCTEAGEVTGLLSIGTDVTKRVHAERALRKSEERYRTLYNRTPAMLHSIDAEGRLLNVSNFWLERLGYKRKEVIGRKSVDFLTPASREVALREVLPELFLRGCSRDIPYQMVTKEGEVVDVLLSATLEKDEAENVIQTLAVTNDVTKQKKIENELREAREIWKKAFDAVCVGMTISREADGVILRANAGYSAIVGYDREELLGRTTVELGILSPEQRERFLAEVRKQGTLHNQELSFRNGKGDVRRVLFSLSRINVRNEPCLLATLVDITDRKQESWG